MIALVTDPDLNVVGPPIHVWRRVEILLRFNEVSVGTLLTPVTPSLRAQLEPGNRIVFIRKGATLLAGPIEHSHFVWSVDGETADPGLVEIAWADDLAHIAARVTYPNPAVAATEQDVDARVFTSTNAETIMRTLVNENSGPGALEPRRIPQLALGTVAGVGSAVTHTTRFQPLADELRAVAVAGGGLGFRTRQAGSTILFEVYAPDDRSQQVRFSPLLGNMQQYQLEQAAPTVSTAIVGGEDAGQARVIRERSNAGAESGWGRRELFIDRRAYDEVGELDDAGDEALADGGERAFLPVVTVDTPTQRFGDSYQLGDRVSIALDVGAQVTDVVRAVRIQHTPDGGEVVTSMVGSPSASAEPEWVRQARRLARQLARSATAGELPSG